MNVAPFARRNVLIAALAVAFALAPQIAEAFPSSRVGSRMVWDQARGFGVLFGGASAPDVAFIRWPMKDTWEWNGQRWIERHPSVSPPARFGHGMVYDTANERVVVFGGSDRTTLFNDLWIYKDKAWSELVAANPPAARRYVAMAWDPDREVIVLHGGNDADTLTWLGDTWEFDGIAWTRIVANGPVLQNATMEYDRRADEMLLVGQNAELKSEMYRLSGNAWQKLTPSKLPECVGQASMIYMNHTDSVILVGGYCGSGAPTDDTHEWNGTDWRELGAQPTQGFVSSFALTYDPIRMEMVLFGGDEYGARNTTLIFRDNSWRTVRKTYAPGPRSLYVFESDPVNGVGWLYGGFNDYDSYADLWKYTNGTWQQVYLASTPTTCGYPVAAWDESRNRLVIHCQGEGPHEFDGSTWTPPPTGLSKKPVSARFSSMTYDPVSKRVALFGGWDEVNYLRNLWFWDGREWKEAPRDNSPKGRSLAAFFHDPISKKLIVFGGIGRKTTEDRIERFGDTFSFDGTKWTLLTPATSPSPRYGMFVEYDPAIGRVVMFGGKNEKEEYINEQWEWDGSNWVRRDVANRPAPRMNGSMIVDPARQQLTLYGGFAGQYYSDLWVFNGTTWEVLEDPGTRGRAVGRSVLPQATSGRKVVPENEPPAEAPAGLRDRARAKTRERH